MSLSEDIRPEISTGFDKEKYSFLVLKYHEVQVGETGEEDPDKILDNLIFNYPEEDNTTLSRLIGILISFATFSKINMNSMITSFTCSQSKIAIKSIKLSENDYMLMVIRILNSKTKISIHDLKKLLNFILSALELTDPYLSKLIQVQHVSNLEETYLKLKNFFENRNTTFLIKFYLDNLEMNNPLDISVNPIYGVSIKPIIPITSELFYLVQKISPDILGQAFLIINPSFQDFPTPKPTISSLRLINSTFSPSFHSFYLPYYICKLSFQKISSIYHSFLPIWSTKEFITNIHISDKRPYRTRPVPQDPISIPTDERRKMTLALVYFPLQNVKSRFEQKGDITNEGVEKEKEIVLENVNNCYLIYSYVIDSNEENTLWKIDEDIQELFIQDFDKLIPTIEAGLNENLLNQRSKTIPAKFQSAVVFNDSHYMLTQIGEGKEKNKVLHNLAEINNSLETGNIEEMDYDGIMVRYGMMAKKVKVLLHETVKISKRTDINHFLPGLYEEVFEESKKLIGMN